MDTGWLVAKRKLEHYRRLLGEERDRARRPVLQSLMSGEQTKVDLLSVLRTEPEKRGRG